MVHLTSSPSPLFQIRLQDDALIMHGSQTESVGCVLRGQLVLSITEPTKFKEIKLLFQGKSKIAWVDGTGKGQYFHDEKKILYEHNWTFLQAKKHQVLKPDNYHWDFELILPGTLPETIEGCQHGSVKYTLKAVAERPAAFALNLHAQREVTLLRSLLQPLEHLQSAFISSTWINKVIYEFSANSTVFGLGDKISVIINLTSLEKDLKIQNILCVFKEYTTYRARMCHKTVSKPIVVITETNFTQKVDSWNHFMEVQIPNNSAYCLYDSENDIIRVNHKLKFYVRFINSENRVCELRASLPVIITSSPNSDIMDLPAYNENGNENFEKMYFDDDLSLSRQDTLSSISSSPCSSFSETLREIEDLNKLPSYRSISSLIPAPLADSLLPPTYYDSLKLIN